MSFNDTCAAPVITQLDTASDHEPTIAPSMSNHQELEEQATQEEVEQGDSTSVTQLYLDRTPEK